jgi:hypothetical protein
MHELRKLLSSVRVQLIQRFIAVRLLALKLIASQAALRLDIRLGARDVFNTGMTNILLECLLGMSAGTVFPRQKSPGMILRNSHFLYNKAFPLTLSHDFLKAYVC